MDRLSGRVTKFFPIRTSPRPTALIKDRTTLPGDIQETHASGGPTAKLYASRLLW
ncbi:MAG: hypothetical protein VB876_04975 [Pirellulales bacterium]